MKILIAFLMIVFISIFSFELANAAGSDRNLKHLQKEAAFRELIFYIESPEAMSSGIPYYPPKPWWAVWFLGDLWESSVKEELADKARERYLNLLASGNASDEEIAAAEKAWKTLMYSTLNSLIDFIKNVPGTSITGPPSKVDKLAAKYIEELLKEAWKNIK